MNKYLKYGFIIVSSILIVILIGVTYAFFNYTRTGAANNVRVGNIYFSSNEGNAITLTNMFPMTQLEAESADLDELTISLQGNTDYSGGEEFVVRIDSLSNSIGTGEYNTQVPVNYIATYEAASGNTIGTSSNNYWSDRNTSENSIYYLSSYGDAMPNKEILVGYIAPGASGINGTLTIKTYIDSNRVSITDTYSITGYGLNRNMSSSELNMCIYFASSYWGITRDKARPYCLGEANDKGYTFDDDLLEFSSNPDAFNFLIARNIIVDNTDEMGTTSTWVNGRRTIKTEEWNSFSTTPISFKLKVESREGIWVNGNGTISSCQGCKYMYVNNYDFMYTTWNVWNDPPTVVTSGYSENYLNIINSSGRHYFLGLKLNDNNQITNVYSCGIKNDSPFCLESSSDGSTYEANKALMQSLWGDACIIGNNGNIEGIKCGGWDGSEDINSVATSEGLTDIGYKPIIHCGGSSYGELGCSSN